MAGNKGTANSPTSGTKSPADKTAAGRKTSLSPSVPASGGSSFQLRKKDSILIERKKDGDESVLDELCMELRKGLQYSIAKLRRALMANKVTVDRRDEFGCTLLMSAAQGGLLQSIFDLVKRNVDLDQRDPDGNTAMHYAVLHGHTAIADALEEAGADRSPQNWVGESPQDISSQRLGQRAFRELRQGLSG